MTPCSANARTLADAPVRKRTFITGPASTDVTSAMVTSATNNGARMSPPSSATSARMIPIAPREFIPNPTLNASRQHHRQRHAGERRGRGLAATTPHEREVDLEPREREEQHGREQREPRQHVRRRTGGEQPRHRRGNESTEHRRSEQDTGEQLASDRGEPNATRELPEDACSREQHRKSDEEHRDVVLGHACTRSARLRRSRKGESLTLRHLRSNEPSNTSRSKEGEIMDQGSPHPKGALALILVYLATLAGFWIETYLRLWIPRGR